MRGKRTPQAPLAYVALALVVFVAACTDSDPEATSTSTTTTSTIPGATTTTGAGSGVVFDKGVTDAPCPDAINPDNGCIYLGVISDLTIGPNAAVGQQTTQANRDFWQRVNEAGGVGGLFDVAFTLDATFDAGSNVEAAAEGFVEIEPTILALAQSLGTGPTRAAIDRYAAADVVVVPTTRWSGWAFPEYDRGVVIESAAPYCVEAQNGFDFMVQAQGGEFTYGIVAGPGDDGADYVAGIKAAVAWNGFAPPLFEATQVPVSEGGDVVGAVEAIVGSDPDVVFVASGPVELSQIAAAAYGGGWQGSLVGAAPTWIPGLLGKSEELDQILQAALFETAAVPNWDADTPGHGAMRDAAAAVGIPAGPDYLAGWVSQYPLLALLEAAVAAGDLSRANLVALAATLADVSYEEMLPPRSYAGTPAESVPRGSVVNRVDPNGSDGTSTAAPYFTGPAAAAHLMAGPCSGA